MTERVYVATAPKGSNVPNRTMTGFVLEIPKEGDVMLHFARPDPADGAQVTALCGATSRASFDYGKPAEGEQWRRKALCRGCLK